MKVRDLVLQSLEEHKGSYISGEELAEQHNVSRAAVWKAINKLKSEGFSIVGVNNKGYMLAENTDVLSAQGVTAYLEDDSKARVEVYKTVTSTNLLLKDRANEAEGLVIAASEQTNGMGRLGRTFVSPLESGIYFSLLLKPNIDNREVTLLTTIAGVAVCEAIEKHTGEKPQIKWVNDVFLGDRKVCGILTQASFSVENLQPEYVIVGIGINLYQPEEGFGKELDKIAGSVLKEKQGDVKNKILAEVINRFMYYYHNFEKKEFVASYKERSLVIGKDILIVRNEESVPAKAVDIDDLCRLKVVFPDGKEETISTGEISIRLQ